MALTDRKEGFMIKNNKGFTLVELIVGIVFVIVILAVLAALIFGGITVVHFVQKFW